MPTYYDTIKGKFFDCPASQIPDGTEDLYRLVKDDSSGELTRYGQALAQGLRPQYEWVFDDVWVYDEELLKRAKGEKIELLNRNYWIKIDAGFTQGANTFSFDPVTRDIISSITNMVQVENALKEADAGYTRKLTTIQLHTVSGDLVVAATLAQWGNFFVTYSKAFYDLNKNYHEKKWYLAKATELTAVQSYDVSL